MKKNIKVIFINIFAILLLILLAETILTYMHFKPISKEDATIKSLYIEKLNHLSPEYFAEEEMRKPAYKNSNLEPIILVGCSRTHGYTLEDKDCFHTILSDATNRTVYNLGLSGGSLKEILYLLRSYNKNLPLYKLTDGTKKVKYVIYVYQIDHKSAIDNCKRAFCPRFEFDKKTKQLVLKDTPLIDNSEIYRSLKNIKSKFKSDEELSNLFAMYIREINKEIKKIYGDETQFVIIDANQRSDKSLDKVDIDDVKLLKLERLTNKNLNSPRYHINARDIHPNRKAWEVIVPALVKELDL